MAESIALGMRLATADELATAAGIEGEISVTEGEWRAVVHDGVTKGGYPLAKLAEAGYSLTKSEDGTKLQLKNKSGVVLSETDAPASGSGVHVGNEAPTDEKTDIWLDLDEDSPAIEVDTSNLIPKTGNRGTLGGYNDCAYYNGHNGAFSVIINKDSPDDICIDAWDETGNNAVECEITFASERDDGAFVKNIFLSGIPEFITVNFEGSVFPEGFFSNYEMELEVGFVTQIIFANYVFAGIVSSKVLVNEK